MPALLFDLDGTLLASDPLHAQVFREIFAERGIEIDEAFYTDRIQGRQNLEIFGEFFPDTNAAIMGDRKEAIFRARLAESVDETAGLSALLERARGGGWKLAVVTNAPRANAHAMLAAIGHEASFDTLVIGDECARGKPDPEPYAEAMRRLGVAPAACLAFEDSRSGLASARAAGAHVLGLDSSLSAEALRAAGAHDVIHDFTDPLIERLLDRLEGPQR